MSETIVHIKGPSLNGTPLPMNRGVEIVSERPGNVLVFPPRDLFQPTRMVAYLTYFASGRFRRGRRLMEGRITGRQDGKVINFDCATGEGIITAREPA